MLIGRLRSWKRRASPLDPALERYLAKLPKLVETSQPGLFWEEQLKGFADTYERL